ncbi:MAG: cobalamin B12-binding domain-containing protein, partial [Polyangia bacterium]
QHRRFRREVVDRFRQSAEPPPDDETERTPAAAWADELLQDDDSGALESHLLAARAELGSWWRLADRIGPALTELGERWQRHEIRVTDEHRASERFARAVARLCAWMPAPATRPRCLLATASGEEHTLGLSLVELCLCERGWAPVWIGRSAPIDDIADAVGRLDVRLCALSASAWSSHPRKLAAEAEQLGLACAAYNVQLVLGGRGAWPERPAYGRVIRDFATFTELLATLGGL